MAVTHAGYAISGGIVVAAISFSPYQEIRGLGMGLLFFMAFIGTGVLIAPVPKARYQVIRPSNHRRAQASDPHLQGDSQIT